MADDLFMAISKADKKRITAAANIVNSELDEWLRHKPEVTKIIQLVQDYPGMFFLSTNNEALKAALDYLQSAVKAHLKR